MKRMIKAAAGLSLGLMATAGIAGAQEVGPTRAVSFGIAGGATIPTGDVADFYGTGFNIMGTLGIQPVAMPVGLRFDVAWHNLGLDEDLVGGDDLRVLSGTANAVLTVSNTGGIKPYLIGGLGAYNLDAGGDSETKFGLNGGGGLEFPLAGFSTFIEARYHHVFTDDEEPGVQLVPLVFGIKFGDRCVPAGSMCEERAAPRSGAALSSHMLPGCVAYRVKNDSPTERPSTSCDAKSSVSKRCV